MERLTRLIEALAGVERLVESDAERELARRQARAAGAGHDRVLRQDVRRGVVPPVKDFLGLAPREQDELFSSLINNHGVEPALEFLGRIQAKAGFFAPSPYWRLVARLTDPIVTKLARALTGIPEGGFEAWLAARGFEPSPPRPGWRHDSTNDRILAEVENPPRSLLWRLHPDPGRLLARAAPGLKQDLIRQQLSADEFTPISVALEFSTKPGGRRIELEVMSKRGNGWGQLFRFMTDRSLDEILG